MRVTLNLAFADTPTPIEPLSSTFECEGGFDPLWLQSYLTMEARQEARWAEFRRQLPKMNELKTPGELTLDLLEDFPGKYFDVTNTKEVWVEILNTIMQAEWLLARARAYKTLETPGADPLKDQDTWRAHFAKMRDFDLATFRITKLEDLFVALLCEGLGASFSFIDQERDPQWERNLTWEKLKKELKERNNPALKAMKDDEYDKLLKMPTQLFSQPIPKLVMYRDETAHRVTPSVDYPQLYTYREDRVGQPVYDKKTGKQTGKTFSILATPTKPKYEFLELYDIAVRSLALYIGVLRVLKAMPRFGLTA